MIHHFETATIGARAARELIARGLVTVEDRLCWIWTPDGPDGAEMRPCAVFADGTHVEVPGYAGDTLERIILVASLSWGDEQEAEFQRCAKTGDWPKRPAPDRTGAVL